MLFPYFMTTLAYASQSTVSVIARFAGEQTSLTLLQNAGHVAQGWRSSAIKSIGAADSGRTHVITFDYRGFGKSTGIPTEEGLIQDGVAVSQ